MMATTAVKIRNALRLMFSSPFVTLDKIKVPLTPACAKSGLVWHCAPILMAGALVSELVMLRESGASSNHGRRWLLDRPLARTMTFMGDSLQRLLSPHQIRRDLGERHDKSDHQAHPQRERPR